jgi:hypothetical protein
MRLWILEFRWWIDRVKEKALMKFVWLLPKQVIYWSVVRAAVKGCEGNPAERTCLEALDAMKS